MAEGPYFLETPYGRVAYQKKGTGPVNIIGLHGFGQDHRLFLPATRHIDLAAYTCYWVDLPFHGFTRWNSNRFTLGQLRAILQMLGRGRPYEGVGHSLGGRLWIHLLPALGRAPRRLHLLAPDGFGNPWSWLIEGTPRPLRKKAGQLLESPQRFLKMAEWLHQVGLINRFALRYLQTHLATPFARQRLFCTWNSLSGMPMNPAAARQTLKRARLPVAITLGSEDIIVPNSRVEAAVRGLTSVEVRYLPCGHWGLARQWKLW